MGLCRGQCGDRAWQSGAGARQDAEGQGPTAAAAATALPAAHAASAGAHGDAHSRHLNLGVWLRGLDAAPAAEPVPGTGARSGGHPVPAWGCPTPRQSCCSGGAVPAVRHGMARLSPPGWPRLRWDRPSPRVGCAPAAPPDTRCCWQDTKVWKPGATPKPSWSMKGGSSWLWICTFTPAS